MTDHDVIARVLGSLGAEGARFVCVTRADPHSGRHVVARMRHQGDALFIKAARDGAVDDEVAALKLARKLAVPAVVAAHSSAFAMTAIAGKPRDWSVDDVVAVAVLMARLHKIAAPKLRPLPGGATLASAVREGDTALALLVAAGTITRRAATIVTKELAHRRKAVDDVVTFADPVSTWLCHGDLRGPNVLFAKGPPQLIDFEHAGRGDPAVDLARTAAYERLEGHRLFVFVDAYAEAAGGDDVVDRALALLPALRLVLLLQRARRLIDGRLAALLTQTQRKTEAAATSSSLEALLQIDFPLVLS
ncbi:MAG: phosphotransferase [Deltaproteobacteria bacterium]|nr:phosphotransferase [Deltaproteobacteria bacterium]